MSTRQNYAPGSPGANPTSQAVNSDHTPPPPVDNRQPTTLDASQQRCFDKLAGFNPTYFQVPIYCALEIPRGEDMGTSQVEVFIESLRFYREHIATNVLESKYKEYVLEVIDDMETIFFDRLYTHISECTNILHGLKYAMKEVDNG